MAAPDDRRERKNRKYVDRATKRSVATRLTTSRVLLSMMIVGQKRQAAFQKFYTFQNDWQTNESTEEYGRPSSQRVTEHSDVYQLKFTQQLF
jgi:hypothetical protein